MEPPSEPEDQRDIEKKAKVSLPLGFCMGIALLDIVLVPLIFGLSTLSGALEGAADHALNSWNAHQMPPKGRVGLIEVAGPSVMMLLGGWGGAAWLVAVNRNRAKPSWQGAVDSATIVAVIVGLVHFVAIATVFTN